MNHTGICRIGSLQQGSIRYGLHPKNYFSFFIRRVLFKITR